MISLLNNASAPTWDDPIEMLYACHGKVKQFCQQLHLLHDHLAQHGCDATAEQAIYQISQYFNRSAPLHHQDEEEDLFPALVSYYPLAQKQIDDLQQQHITLHQNWDALHTQLQETRQGTRSAPDVSLIRAFTDGYQRHIPPEEALFELAKQHIPANHLRELSKKMAQRRMG